MVSPGAELEKRLTESGMSRKELAQRINVSEKHICTVLNGNRGISSAFARKLGYVFADTTFWVNLQAIYDEEQMKLKEMNLISNEELAVLKPLQEIISYFVEKGYIENGCGDVEKVMRLRKFLNVSNLLLIPKITYNAAYRAQLSSNVKADPYVLFAWQRLCEKVAEKDIIDKTLNKEILKQKLQDIKAMMFGGINDGIRNLQDILKECGISFHVVKNFKGAPVQGFIKERYDHRLILCLTIRRQRADTFWFTLFHEIAHILHGDYRMRFVDFDSIDNETEVNANLFAGNILIAPELYRKFIRTNNCTTWSGIEAFAKEAQVQPFIVLGRLQNDGILDWSDYANKVHRYTWA